MSVITRFPPSPTGYFHIGSARTALFNYLFAAHHGGTMVLRFEDTDKARNKKEYEEDILGGLKWLGIQYHLPTPFRQSERTDRYRVALQQLIETDAAYISKEPAKDDPGREVSVVRLRNPGSTIIFEDIVRGKVTFDTAELKDFVIARGIDDPLYNFTVVVDDADMGITHVIRGEDHISNTPRQILILEALGFQRPIYAHIPLILAPDRSKMSKRHGALSVVEYRAQGFLPQAIFNYLALLGWNPGSDQERFTRQELIQQFDIAHVHKGGAIFDIEKLRWFNRQYLQELSDNDFEQYYMPVFADKDAEIAKKLLPIIRAHIATRHELETAVAAGEYEFFFSDPALDANHIPERKSSKDTALKHLGHLHTLVGELPESATVEAIKNALWDYATAEGRGAVLWPFRYALSGRERSPDPFVIASIIGKTAAARRLETAIKALS